MRNSVMHRVAKIIRSTRKRSPAVLEKINGPYFKLALFAVALFSLARPKRFLLWSHRNLYSRLCADPRQIITSDIAALRVRLIMF